MKPASVPSDTPEQARQLAWSAAPGGRGRFPHPPIRGIGWPLLALLFLLFSCAEKQTEYGSASQVRDYLDELKDILQQLRLIEHQIGQAVPADTVSAEVIIPLIETRFQPALTDLHRRASQLHPSSDLDSLHQELLTYLALRMRAFDLAVQGARQGQPELFDEFTRLQSEADQAGRNLERDISRVRQSLR